MEKRNLGGELVVSALGLGCMSMSGAYGGRDDAESRAALRRAVELGITLFDTADVYGPFANEALVGRELAPYRKDLIISTKFGLVRASTGQHLGVNGTPEYVKSSCDLSLQRLGVDHIDIYWQHRVDPDTPIEETVGAMAELVAEGKVRYIGLSEASSETIRRANAVHPLAAVQSEYSLWSRDIETDVLLTTRELGIGTVAYGPLGRGFLTGTIEKQSDLAGNDYRRNSPRFQGEAFDRNLQLVARVREVADEIGCTAGQLALAWVLAQGGDIVPIPGTRRLTNLEQNAAAEGIELTKEQTVRLNEIAPLGAAAGDRYADMSAVI
jgi:aryl-alcohol dehydrogenase-like predicted oxidoreductase